MKASRLARLLGLVALAACARSAAFSGAPPIPGAAEPGSTKIDHVVIIFQENRSVDDLFNGLPGADTVAYGYNSKGRRVPLRPVPLTAPYDLSHAHSAFLDDYDGGKNRGFDTEPSSCDVASICIPRKVRAYGYVPHWEIAPYFTMAQQYAFADRMFQTNQGPSFPAHQYIVSGTSTIADGSSLRAAENPVQAFGAGGGCDSPSGSLVQLIDSTGNESRKMYPCFTRISLMELLERKGLTWRYYQAAPGAGLWNGPDAIVGIRRSAQYGPGVVTPPARVLADVANSPTLFGLLPRPWRRTTRAPPTVRDRRGSLPSSMPSERASIGAIRRSSSRGTTGAAGTITFHRRRTTRTSLGFACRSS